MTLPWWQKPFQFHLDALSLPSRTPSCSGEPLQPLAAAGRQKARLQQGLDITTETEETVLEATESRHIESRPSHPSTIYTIYVVKMFMGGLGGVNDQRPAFLPTVSAVWGV